MQKAIAKLMHVALYALMIGMPLVGWLVLSAEGDADSVLRLASAGPDRTERWSERIHQGNP